MLSFGKYQGAGNDFLLIDHRAPHFSPSLVPLLCNRKYGVGADGVILLENDSQADFRMRIFNSDGSEAESCGNGLRCLLRFISDLGFPKQNYQIATHDRIVQAGFKGDQIWVQMGQALHLEKHFLEGHEIYALNTGVPHAVLFSESADFLSLARKIRHHEVFQPSGTNVNIAWIGNDGKMYARTFERGVEGETLACGTGAAAVGYIASIYKGFSNPIQVCFAGGVIEIEVEGNEITLIGDARSVFEGEIKI